MNETMDFGKITRLEVINETGRVLSRWDIAIQPSVQDDGRTLKLFIKSALGDVAPACPSGVCHTTFEREADGRVIATIDASAYGSTESEAEHAAYRLIASAACPGPSEAAEVDTRKALTMAVVHEMYGEIRRIAQGFDIHSVPLITVMQWADRLKALAASDQWNGIYRGDTRFNEIADGWLRGHSLISEKMTKNLAELIAQCVDSATKPLDARLEQSAAASRVEPPVSHATWCPQHSARRAHPHADVARDRTCNCPEPTARKAR